VSGKPFRNPKSTGVAKDRCKLLTLMVGERRFEPPTPRSRIGCKQILKSIESAVLNCFVFRRVRMHGCELLIFAGSGGFDRSKIDYSRFKSRAV
jgi:hypothetical protein